MLGKNYPNICHNFYKLCPPMPRCTFTHITSFTSPPLLFYHHHHLVSPLPHVYEGVEVAGVRPRLQLDGGGQLRRVCGETRPAPAGQGLGWRQ